MGYTHYWKQLRNLTTDEWAEICTDIGEILKHAQHVVGIPLANGMGDRGTAPEITPDKIWFNGVGPKDDHETFGITRKIDPEDWSFCKTARKPYDLVAAACICYLSSCLEPAAFHFTSDGNGHNFTDGLDLARKAVPRKANTLDYPRGVMEDDRWTGPWVRIYSPGNGGEGASTGFAVHACINGKAYVIADRTGKSYCFPTHLALAEFLDRTKVAKFRSGGRTSWGAYPAVEPNIWNATGNFDAPRHARIAKAQRKVLLTLFPAPAENAQRPPAYVRPMDFPRPEDVGTFCYSFDELLKRVAA